ncbi:phage tail tube protein [Arthrobacter sp. TmT3-37]
MDVRNLTAGGPAATGGILRAPLRSVLPVDASTAFAAAWKRLGLVGEDGLAPSGERNLESIRDWSGDTVADLQTDHSSSFTFPLLEVFNEDVLKTVFGDGNVTVTAQTETRGKLYTIIEDGAQLPFAAYGFDMRYIGKKMRILVPNGKITTVEETPFVVGGLNMFTCTVSAYKDESGKKVYRYYEDEIRAA